MRIELAETSAVEAPITGEADLIFVRQTLRAEAVRAGLGLVDQTKLITAGSELVRNILTYARGTRSGVRVEQVRDGDRRGVRAIFRDEGPGIDDVELALTDGYSTGGSLGLGLPGSRRLVDDLVIDTRAGVGTTVVIVKWRR